MLRRVLATLAKIETNQPGRDVAGVISEEVEAVGRNFTQFKPGDEVFGACLGTYTEYACARESDLAMNGLIKLLDFGIAQLALTSDLNNISHDLRREGVNRRIKGAELLRQVRWIRGLGN